MLKNYFLIALRTLRRQRGYALLNLFGLAVGMSCFLLIMVFVQFELSFDRFYNRAEDIYRIVRESPGRTHLGTSHSVSTATPLAEALVAEFPEVESATSVGRVNAFIGNETRIARESGVFADLNFFLVLGRPLIRGRRANALADPSTIVVSRAMASRYFAGVDPIGQTLTLRWGQDLDLVVTAVMEDLPDNSHLKADFVVSIATDSWYQRNLDSWSNINYSTYLLLKEGSVGHEFERKLPDFASRHLGQDYGNDPDSMPVYHAQRVTDIHLRSFSRFGLASGGKIRDVFLFTAIGLLILGIACINYVNLATARSTSRAREVGVRKSVGAQRAQLARQLIGETVILSCAAVFLALLLTAAVLPDFGELLDRPLGMDSVLQAPFLLAALGLGLLVGVLSGSYPALVMASWNPVHILKGRPQKQRGRARLRSVLVVGQFAVTIILVIGTAVILRQLEYIGTADTGVSRDQVVAIRVSDRTLSSRYASFRDELLRHPAVRQVTSSEYLPTAIESQSTVSTWDGRMDGQQVSVFTSAINYDFAEIYGLELIEGSAPSKEQATDSLGAILLNQKAVRALGWESAVGRRFDLGGTRGQRVVGVVKDFHYQTFRMDIAPLALYLDPGNMRHIQVKIRPEGVSETLAFLQSTAERFSPGYAFEYRFLDEAYNRMYRADERLGKMFAAFAMLALAIAGFGLLGLAALAGAQRKKEIGVRKVLGAKFSDIVGLLSRDFSGLILVAFVIAAPISYLAVSRWLEGFAYRIDVGFGLFAAAGLGVTVISSLIVGYQSIRAAAMNPLHSLRHD